METKASKKRLFITTGLISLLNALYIIETKQQNCSDTLVIVSFEQSESFKKTTKTIAKNHNFDKIIFYKKPKEVIKNINFKEYDEIYSVTFIEFLKKAKTNKNFYWFDEGPGYAIKDIKNLKQIKGVYYTPFLEKFSFLNTNKKSEEFEIKKDTFNLLSEKILNSTEKDIEIKGQKNVLFISHYILQQLGKVKAFEFHKKYIDYFINLGYTVYYKPHPRDTGALAFELSEAYKNNDKFKLFNNTLPIELYNYPFDIVIGTYSGALISIPHYKNIASLNLPSRELFDLDVGINFKKFFILYEYYTPKFSEMKEVLNKDKEEIYRKYYEIISKKQPINENESLKEILCYKPNKIKDLLFGFFSCLIFFNKNLSKKIKNISRSDFNKLIKNFLEKN